MIVKWRTNTNARSGIRRVECARETKQCVFLTRSGGRGGEYRVAKDGAYEIYHDTWEAARDYILEQSKNEAIDAERELNDAINRTIEIQKMTPPADDIK